MSFADFTISILSALSTVTWVPAAKPIFTGDCATAFAVTVSGVSRVSRPSLTARKVTYAVISLVTEAGYQAWPAFCAYSTLPLSASLTSSASAFARVAVRPVAAQARPAHIRVRATKNRVGNCTVRGPIVWARRGNALRAEAVCVGGRLMKGKSGEPPIDAAELSVS